jgi:hypothetical protein
MGSCHACEVEIEEVGDVCPCITAVPPSYGKLTVNLFSDPTWQWALAFDFGILFHCIFPPTLEWVVFVRYVSPFDPNGIQHIP